MPKSDRLARAVDVCNEAIRRYSDTKRAADRATQESVLSAERLSSAVADLDKVLIDLDSTGTSSREIQELKLHSNYNLKILHSVFRNGMRAKDVSTKTIDVVKD